MLFLFDNYESFLIAVQAGPTFPTNIYVIIKILALDNDNKLINRKHE